MKKEREKESRLEGFLKFYVSKEADKGEYNFLDEILSDKVIHSIDDDLAFELIKDNRLWMITYGEDHAQFNGVVKKTRYGLKKGINDYERQIRRADFFIRSKNALDSRGFQEVVADENMPVVCSYCGLYQDKEGGDYGIPSNIEELKGRKSHGMCKPCRGILDDLKP